jgi:putative NIF3 family GTP cyclohydrolase 1 type 2
MKLSDLYNLAVKFGKDRDPRIASKIESFEDSSILYGNPDTQIKKVLVGIDIEAAEILMADSIRKNEGLDLVISHHPEGRSFAILYKVMRLQADVLKKAGLSETVAIELMDERMQEVQRRLLPQNHTRAVDAARLLKMPFMCIHTPADNHVFSFLQKLLNQRNPRKVQDIIKILLELDEYRLAASIEVGPRVILGSPRRAAGRILVDMTGGTEGSKDVFDKLYKAGIRTIICMHLSEEHLKKTKDAGLNVVIAGHIASDNLGLNLLLDRIEKKTGEFLETIDCSGFNRIRRKQL